MRRRAILTASALLLLAAGVTFVTSPRKESEPVRITLTPRTAMGIPGARIAGSSAAPLSAEQDAVPPERQWGRAQITGDPEHWPPNRADWSDEPDQWELRRVADVREIPVAVRSALEPLDCAIPSYRSQAVNSSVVWGEFERPGQRDLAVLCVHADKTSATYVFWASDPRRREVMPRSGSAINTATRADMNVRLDPGSPREPDMPITLDHDGLEIGCCECCSTIYYRHGGQWFTLAGAD